MYYSKLKWLLIAAVATGYARSDALAYESAPGAWAVVTLTDTFRHEGESSP